MKAISTCHFNIEPLGALTELNLSKKDFADIMGISANTVSNWGSKFPTYAVEWLKLQIEANTRITCAEDRASRIIEQEREKRIIPKQYWDNVEAIVDIIWDRGVELYEEENGLKPTYADDVRDIIRDNNIDGEQVDQDEWMIYTRYHAAICEHSDNPEAYQDIGLELSGDWSRIQQLVAYCALEADVRDMLNDKELEEEEEE